MNNFLRLSCILMAIIAGKALFSAEKSVLMLNESNCSHSVIYNGLIYWPLTYQEGAYENSE